MLLQDLENELLSETQQTELVNFGAEPLWAASTNPQLSKAKIDHYINRAITRILADLSETEVAGVTVSWLSVANTSQYPIPPPPAFEGQPLNPPIHEGQRVYYKPVGQPQTVEFMAGLGLISWDEFQRECGAGYLRPFAFGSIPKCCAVDPQRQNLCFFPGAANSGDVITFKYSPVPTDGTTVPLLAAPLDASILPNECTDAIVMLASPPIWRSLREFGAAKDAALRYDNPQDGGELGRLKKVLLKRTRGDKLRITDARLDILSAGPWQMND